MGCFLGVCIYFFDSSVNSVACCHFMGFVSFSLVGLGFCLILGATGMSGPCEMCEN